jgi:RNA polymerase sigma-70 factor (ECF subfamily)
VDAIDKHCAQIQASGSTTSLEAAEAARTYLTEALVATGKGDCRAFSDVYERTSAKLFGICLRVCGERAVAQEVLQEVYLKVWRNAGAFDPLRSSPVTWLAMIARNRSIDWKRTQGDRTVAQLTDAMMVIDSSENPEAAAISSYENRRLHVSLSALQPRQRESIQSVFLEGLTYQEVATRTRKPLGTVKSDIRRGLARLRDDLGTGCRTEVRFGHAQAARG